MKTGLARVAVVPLALGMAFLAGCSAQGDTPENQDSPKPVEALAAFVEDIKTDTEGYTSKVSTAENSEAKKEIHAQEYAESFEHLDSTALNEAQKLEIVDQFSMIYLLYPNANITTSEDAFAVTDKTATLNGSDIEFTVDGQKQEVSSSTKLSMTLTDAGWKISKFEGTGK